MYCGGFKEGRKHKEGELRYPNGRMYVGSFKNGRKHGRGTYVLADGSKYEGFFKHGTVIIPWENSCSREVLMR